MDGRWWTWTVVLWTNGGHEAALLPVHVIAGARRRPARRRHLPRPAPVDPGGVEHRSLGQDYPTAIVTHNMLCQTKDGSHHISG